MGWLAYHRLSQVSSTLFCLTACLLCVAGCNNTCITGTLNAPSGSSVAVKTGSSPPSCTLSTANGIVHLEIGAASGGGSAPGITAFAMERPFVTQLFVTLDGIDVHSSPLASDDTPGWQALAPQLQTHPVQIDLLAEPHGNASAAPFPDAIVPTGTYRQIRLRLASQPPAAAGATNLSSTSLLPASLAPSNVSLLEPALETKRCGDGVAHCAVMSDGRVWPVALPPSRPHWRIMLEGTPGRELYVPPDSAVSLVIELDRDRTWVWPSGDSMLFAPIFHLRVQQPFNVSEN